MKRDVTRALTMVLVIMCLAGTVSPIVESWWKERSMPRGELVIEELRQAYLTGQFDRACDRARIDAAKPENAAYRPCILYIRWLACRKGSRDREAQDIETLFLREFPRHMLTADMRFSRAVALIRDGKDAAADRELEAIERYTPTASVAVKAYTLRTRLLGTEGTREAPGERSQLAQKQQQQLQ